MLTVSGNVNPPPPKNRQELFMCFKTGKTCLKLCETFRNASLYKMRQYCIYDRHVLTHVDNTYLLIPSQFLISLSTEYDAKIVSTNCFEHFKHCHCIRVDGLKKSNQTESG
jgi:hypothetical protein